MSNKVREIVAELRQDHANMRLLLDLIEREATCLYDGGTPDYELLHDILQYMTTYPDAVHHPKEDRLYAEMRTARPDLTSGFQRISVDHRDLAEAGRKVRDELAAINAGAMLERNDVVADALRYVHTLRSHMQWEELDLFRRSLKMARDGHELMSADNVVGANDPLFGEKVEAEFQRLYQQIKSAGNDGPRQAAE